MEKESLLINIFSLSLINLCVCVSNVMFHPLSPPGSDNFAGITTPHILAYKHYHVFMSCVMFVVFVGFCHSKTFHSS